MSRSLVILILAAGIGSLASADPPAPKAPAETRSSADQKSPDATTQPNSTPAAAATPATSATAAADSSQAARPAASSSDQSQREALLLDQGYKPAMRNGEKVFCKREIPMGSRLASALHCLTVDEADLIAKEGREATERIQRNTVGCLSPAAGGCGK